MCGLDVFMKHNILFFLIFTIDSFFLNVFWLMNIENWSNFRNVLQLGFPFRLISFRYYFTSNTNTSCWIWRTIPSFINYLLLFNW